MKLIPEELIEETALSFSYYATEQYGFKEGALFAEKQLAPLFVEFATWCSQNYCTLDGNWMPQNAWSDFCVAENLKTSSEIFEEFINVKKQQLWVQKNLTSK